MSQEHLRKYSKIFGLNGQELFLKFKYFIITDLIGKWFLVGICFEITLLVGDFADKHFSLPLK